LAFRATFASVPDPSKLYVFSAPVAVPGFCCIRPEFFGPGLLPQGALYHVVKIERGPEAVDCEVNCRSCGILLPGREANFVLKCFMLRKAGRAQKSPRA
jgi:hypothetical protein